MPSCLLGDCGGVLDWFALLHLLLVYGNHCSIAIHTGYPDPDDVLNPWIMGWWRILRFSRWSFLVTVRTGYPSVHFRP